MKVETAEVQKPDAIVGAWGGRSGHSSRETTLLTKEIKILHKNWTVYVYKPIQHNVCSCLQLSFAQIQQINFL